MARKNLIRTRPAPLGLGTAGFLPNLYDLAIFILLGGVFVLIAHGAHEMAAPAARLSAEPVTLDPANLPEYALRTTLRMFAAIIASLVFTFVVATLAAKSRKAGLVIVPALDSLQSVPVLGFLTKRVLDELGTHAAPDSRFRDELEDHMSVQLAEQTLRTVTSWACYGEIFAYDEARGGFSLDNPA